MFIIAMFRACVKEKRCFSKKALTFFPRTAKIQPNANAWNGRFPLKKASREGAGGASAQAGRGMVARERTA